MPLHCMSGGGPRQAQVATPRQAHVATNIQTKLPLLAVCVALLVQQLVIKPINEEKDRFLLFYIRRE